MVRTPSVTMRWPGCTPPITLLAALAVLLGACGSPAGPKPCTDCQQQEQPPAVLMNVEIFFGEIGVGAELTKTLDVPNSGKDPLIVQESKADLSPIKTSLDCDGPCGSRTVQPGGVLTMAFTAHPLQAGGIVRDVVFASNHGSIEVRLGASGIVPAFSCEPVDKLDFGAVVPGDSFTLPISCSNTTAADGAITVEPIVGDTDQFGVSLSSPVAVPALSKVSVPVTFKPTVDKEGQPSSATIRLDRPDGSLLDSVLASGTGVPYALEIDPAPPYDFGVVTAGGPGATKNVILRDLTVASIGVFGIAMAKDSDPEFAVYAPTTGTFYVPGTQSMDNEVDILVTFAPPAGDVGPRHGTVEITSEDPGGAVRSFEVSGTGG